MKKRKVLFVVHQLNHGGVQKSLITALNAIDYTQNEVTLYIRKSRTQLLDMVNPKVHRIIINDDKTHYYRKPYMIYLQICKKICELLQKNNKSESIQKEIAMHLNQEQMKYEIAHNVELQESYDVAISYIQGYTAKFVAQYVNAKKKVMFFHGSTDETHELHEEIMPSFDYIVGVNENVQRILENLYPACAEKMTYIENYVDAEEIREKAKAFTIEKEDTRIVLCSCGRLTPVKGFDLAVEAAKKLRSSGVNFIWYFVGDGSERSKIENLITQYELESNIIITGMQDNPYPYIAACDIYVQPSYEEAHPLTIEEAFILRKPVVTTNTVGGMVLVSNSTDGVVTNMDGVAIAEGVKTILKDKDFQGKMEQHLKDKNYEECAEEYRANWKRILEE